MVHECHATGCRTRVAPHLWGCRKHWTMVPVEIRNEVWRHYRRGQERDKNPSIGYLKAARAAVVAVAELEGLTPDTRLYDALIEELEGVSVDPRGTDEGNAGGQG